MSNGRASFCWLPSGRRAVRSALCSAVETIAYVASQDVGENDVRSALVGPAIVILPFRAQ